MPIEVKELVMRFNVGHRGNSNLAKHNEQALARRVNNDIELIVATCVEQVLDILERAQER